MPGVILGTAAYMSPEQARGQNVDQRADMWAFGVILFEMLTGKQLFAGETVSDTLANVLAGKLREAAHMDACLISRWDAESGRLVPIGAHGRPLIGPERSAAR